MSAFGYALPWLIASLAFGLITDMVMHRGYGQRACLCAMLSGAFAVQACYSFFLH